MNIRDRIARLEVMGLGADKGESIREYCTRMQMHWADILLESYCDGRLDELAADRAIPVWQLLEALRLTGDAVLIGSHWHPLFVGDDDQTNDRVRAIFEANWRPHWDTEIRAVQEAAIRRQASP